MNKSFSRLSCNSDYDRRCHRPKTKLATMPMFAMASFCNVGDAESHWEPVNQGLTELRATSVAVDSQGRVFVGTIGGGVFRSLDGGDSWAPANDGLANLSISRMVVAGGDGLFVGTGIATPGSVDNGIYLSNDHGDNWTLSHAPSLDLGSYLYAMATDGASTVVYSGGQGAFRTIDNGQNWSPFGSESSLGSLLNVDAGKVWAGSAEILDAAYLYLLSADGDTELSIELSHNTLESRADDAVLVLTELFNGTMLAGTMNLAQGRVYRSTDHGSTWPDRQEFPKVVHAIIQTPEGDIMLGLGGYGIDDDILLNDGPGALRSTDNGQTWADIGDGVLTDKDVRALAIAPNGVVFAATLGDGVYRSTFTVPVELSGFVIE